MSHASLPAAVPVAASPRVAGLLAAADGPLEVVHRGPDAVYVALGGEPGDRAVGVLSRAAVPVPCGLRSRLAEVPDGRAVVAGGVLHLGGVPLPVARLVDVRVPRIDPALVRPGTLDLADVDRLVGLGPGLTPYGDDVLCGWLAVHRAAGIATDEVDARVGALAGRTTLLSATLLDCAVRGEVVPAFGVWLAALETPREAAAADAVLAVGASSGAGLLAGAALALGRRSSVDVDDGIGRIAA
ncbi:DUF2877 domain-containing protein [Nocardioides taihuensis]|uniref:DUF2877 domain-containing protein n=1 Tax=Nocardioides taihuensis TaxID=1835606 RepID=A0ABW0BLW7_9ACTN